MKQRFGLSGYQLKIVAIIFMLLDHIYLEVLLGLPGIPDFSILDMASRFVSPLFFFLMIEGFFYTRSRKKYLTRLLIAGAVMALGNLVIHYLMNVSISFFTILNPNIFLSLACGFGAVWLLDRKEENIADCSAHFRFSSFNIYRSKFSCSNPSIFNVRIT